MKFIVFVALAAVLFATISANDKCPTICPLNYAPFCAALEGKPERKTTFSNDCEMLAYNCQHKDTRYYKLSDGECP